MTRSKIKSSAITDSTIATGDIADDAVTGVKLANDISIAGDLTVTGNDINTAGSMLLKPAGTEIVNINNTGDVIVKGQGSNRGMLVLRAGSNTSNSQIRFGDQATDVAGRIMYDHSSNFMRFDTNESEKMRLTSDGLTFNGDTAAANALDDYEEGTWTPTFTGASSNPSITYTVQIGYYTKIGNIVYATCDMRWNAWSGGGGHLRINTLPFATNGAGSGQYQNGVNINYFFGASATVRGGYFESDTTYYYARLSSDNTSLLAANQVSTSGHFMGTVVYRTNA